MSLSDLASLGSFVSGIAVVASLIYLTLQVRQAERNQRVLVQQARAARVSDLMFHLADPALQEVWDKGLNGDGDISLLQLGQFKSLMRASLFNMEDTLLLHNAGLISDDVFAGLRGFLKVTTSRAGWRAAWKQLRVERGKEFSDFIDQIVGETAATARADELANWRAAVAAERPAPSH